MDGDVVRCTGCPRWLGVQRDGYVESRRKGRPIKIVEGEIGCEQCGASVQIQGGRPVTAPIASVAR
jgi:hypothetical protein